MRPLEKQRTSRSGCLNEVIGELLLFGCELGPDLTPRPGTLHANRLGQREWSNRLLLAEPTRCGNENPGQEKQGEAHTRVLVDGSSLQRVKERPPTIL